MGRVGEGAQGSSLHCTSVSGRSCAVLWCAPREHHQGQGVLLLYSYRIHSLPNPRPTHPRRPTATSSQPLARQPTAPNPNPNLRPASQLTPPMRLSNLLPLDPPLGLVAVNSQPCAHQTAHPLHQLVAINSHPRARRRQLPTPAPIKLPTPCTHRLDLSPSLSRRSPASFITRPVASSASAALASTLLHQAGGKVIACGCACSGGGAEKLKT